MAKQSGLGDRLFVAGYDVSGDIGSLDQISGNIKTLDATGIDKFAMERIPGLRDGNIDFTAYFNPETVVSTQEHAVFSTLPTADVLLTYCRGTTLGNPAACMVGKQINYDAKRAADGALTYSISAQANAYGLEWGTQHTAGKRTDTTATNGASVDGGAASAFGLQAYLQVFALTGTSVTVKIQSSSDDGAGDAYSDITGGTFTAATGVTTQRLQTAASQAVERYLRVVTTGTFTSAIFSVVVVRNLVANATF